MLQRRSQIVIALIAWQLASAAVMRCERFTGPLTLEIYTRMFGDVQLSDERFEWVAMTVAYLLRTVVATLVSLMVFEKLNHRAIRWRRLEVTLVTWVVAVMIALLVAFRFSLHWQFHRIDWALFGPPASLYTFRNLLLPWLLSWLVCTAPVGTIVLTIFNGQDSRCRCLLSQVL